MDCRSNCCLVFSLLIIFPLLCFHSRADGTGSVFFLDSTSHQYLRPQSSDSTAEKILILFPEVVGAVSVLLGVPPPILASSSSDKLNEVLMPNPFDRPRAVFMLEVNGVKVGSNDEFSTNVIEREVFMNQSDAEIHLPDEDEVSVISLNEPLSFDSDSGFTDKDIDYFATWLGGSYVANPAEKLTGDLIFPYSNDARLKLRMSKKADREFTTSLMSLIHNIQKAIDIHNDLSGVNIRSELLTGSFDGIKALQEQYGRDAAQQGLELFVASVSKIFDSLQTAYKGKIVGVMLFKGESESSEKVLKVKVSPRPYARWLEEKKQASLNSTLIVKVALVRTTLAWITGIIFIIATVLGTCCLMNMPLTRDTLLYSNVKLD
jgi:renin receptor